MRGSIVREVTRIGLYGEGKERVSKVVLYG